MDTMNIALPGNLKDYVQSRVAEGGYSSVSEYIRELIRADQKQSAEQLLEQEILRGLNSGEPAPMTGDDWNDIRLEVKRRFLDRKSST
jgi:antitoxin ParD1/3/4